jgi:hypothetical protein
MRALFVALAVLVMACTQPRSPRCREVCARQAECRELAGKESDSSFDEKECVAQCTALETDADTRHIVDERVECFAKPDACKQCK